MRDGRAYLRFMSDMWAQVFSDSGASLSLLLGVQADILNRLYMQAVQASSLKFANEINVFREDFWHIVSIRETDRVEGVDTLYRYRLSTPYERMPFLYNKIFDPTLRLMTDLDYWVSTEPASGGDDDRAGYITFQFDPFKNDLIPRRLVGRVDGKDVYELAMFAPKVYIDEQDIWRQWGHLVNIFQPSSENYRQLVYGVLYIYAHGPVIHPLNAGLNLAAGFPVARDPETILEIEDRRLGKAKGQYIVRTANNTYQVPYSIMDSIGREIKTPTLSVKVGDRLKRLSSFIDDIQVVDYRTEGYSKWWAGPDGNTDPSLRLVGFLPPEMAPQIDEKLRDHLPTIDHLFDTYFKYATFGAKINTLALQTFNAVSDFFEVLYDAKPAYTAPYSNAFTPVEDLVASDVDPAEVFNRGGVALDPESATLLYRDRHDSAALDPGESRQGRFGWGAHERVVEDAGSVREAIEAEIEWDETYRGSLRRILGAARPLDADPYAFFNVGGLRYVHKNHTRERPLFTNDLREARLVKRFMIGTSRAQFQPFLDTARDRFTIDAEVDLVNRYGFYGGRIVIGGKARVGKHPVGHVIEGVVMDARFDVRDDFLLPTQQVSVWLEEVELAAPVISGDVSFIKAPDGLEGSLLD